VRQRRASDPLLPLELFRNRDFTLVNVETLLVYGALAGSMFYLGLYLQTVIGYSPFEAGLLLLPSTVVLLLLAPRIGRLADQFGPRPFLVAGPVLMAGGMLLWLRVDDRSVWDGLFPGLVLYGLGLSMIVAPITAAALTTVSEDHAGVAAGVNSTFSRLGSLISIAVLGLVVSLVFSSRTDDPDLIPLALDQPGEEFITGSTDAFRAAIVVAAALAVAGAMTAFSLTRRERPSVTAAAEDEALAPTLRLDPAAPDCPAALPAPRRSEEVPARAVRAPSVPS
jgi:Na+/melibiose symporter-like transporter